MGTDREKLMIVVVIVENLPKRKTRQTVWTVKGDPKEIVESMLPIHSIRGNVKVWTIVRPD